MQTRYTADGGLPKEKNKGNYAWTEIHATKDVESVLWHEGGDVSLNIY